MVARIRMALVAAAGVAALMQAGCDFDCGCDAQYEKCLAEAPPGAAKADCARQQETCEAQCDASQAREEEEHGVR